MVQQAIGTGYVIAIDGPSGCGKSTVARSVAAQLQAGYLDTGAMYRALTWWLLRRGVDVNDPAAVDAALADFSLQVTCAPHAPTISVGGQDVTKAIRSAAVTEAVSAVAANPRVRVALIARQREIIDAHRASGQGIVAEGRDLTTVVSPDADLRVLLTASAAERQRRRTAQDGAALAASMDRRDRRDLQVNDFVNPAPGVHLLDTTQMTQAQASAALLDLID